MAGLHIAKKELRQRIKQFLGDVTTESLQSQTKHAVTRFLKLPQYENAGRISVYLSMPTGEIGTTDIVRHALNAGKQVFVPYFYRLTQAKEGQPTSVMDMLELTSMADFEGLKPDKWGIPTLGKDSIAARQNSFGGHGKSEGSAEGSESIEKAALDLIILPGMAFDTSMGRLGHGKGFYDYFLGRTNGAYASRGLKMPYLVGLALNEQVLPQGETVPRDETDWKLDLIVDGDGNLLQLSTDAA